LHFSIWELHLQLLEQVSSSQIFLQWLGSFIKWGTVVEMLVLLFYSGINIGALLGGAVCVYLGTSPDYGWSYAFLSAAIVMVIGLILF
jgi:predicted MFS family arabinose efflux permease